MLHRELWLQLHFVVTYLPKHLLQCLCFTLQAKMFYSNASHSTVDQESTEALGTYIHPGISCLPQHLQDRTSLLRHKCNRHQVKNNFSNLSPQVKNFNKPVAEGNNLSQGCLVLASRNPYTNRFILGLAIQN